MQTADVLAVPPPQLSPDRAADVARSSWGVAVAQVVPLVSERDQNFRLRADDGSEWVLKVSNSAEDRGVVEMEVAAVARVAALDPTLPVPLARPTLGDEPVARIEIDGVEHLVRLIPLLPGRNPHPEELTLENVRAIGEVVARTAYALRGFFHPAAGRMIWWDQRHLPRLFEHAALVPDGPRRALLDRVIGRFTNRVVPLLPTLRAQVIHNDLTLDNLLVDPTGTVTGIIDFGDMAHTALVLDVPATLQSLFRQRADDLLDLADAFLAGYTSVIGLEEQEGELLADLLAGRMVQTILISAQRTRQYPDNAYIQGWSEPAWQLLEELERIGWEAVGRRLATAAGRRAWRPAGGWADDGTLLARRRRVLGTALEPLSYRRPLHLVEGSGAWMIDADGRRYLDAYNNVPVVGHSHPRVAQAIARQAATLNTNTRYLHEHVVRLAERLTATMPEGLDTVMFVNSGSEANDLAWRLATTVTGGDTGIVTDWAYHGVTHAIADFSPSEWPQGRQPDAVETYPAPNTYRGRYVDADDPAVQAAQEMRAALGRIADRGRQPAALFVDSGFTADGIFVPPPELVASIMESAREAGAFVIADEVQSGFGRMGDDLWGFRAWGITPDIVTLGKPMGNGHPVAAVVTRHEIVDELAKVTTFFSTFGGNPVACAAALAVLDVIEDEGLVANAATVGSRMRDAIGALSSVHAAIGDIRGRGLMTGVQLVRDRSTREPDTELAARVKEGLREHGVLVGTTGRDGSTLKIRPPLCLRPDEADLLVVRLDEVLTAFGA